MRLHETVTTLVHKTTSVHTGKVRYAVRIWNGSKWELAILKATVMSPKCPLRFPTMAAAMRAADYINENPKAAANKLKCN
jgi:hypothetical protein